MKFIFKSEVIDYEFIFKNKQDTILLLHGWGGNMNSFCQLEKLLTCDFNILKITMPTIDTTVTPWTVFDYCNLVENLIQLLGVENLNIVCHSFGFRVAMLLNKKIKINKIIVTGGAGIFKDNFVRKIFMRNNKILLSNSRFKNLFNSIASDDYKSLSKTGKITFKNIVNLNLVSCLKFNSEMMLFWGTHDSSTKLWIAKKIKKINKCKLIVSKSDHFAYLKDNVKFCHYAINFLKNKKMI